MSTDTLPSLELPAPVAVRSSDLLCLVGEFSTIVADPPWDVKAGPRSLHDPNERSRELKYSTMTVEEIAAMPVKQKAAKNAHQWHMYP